MPSKQSTSINFLLQISDRQFLSSSLLRLGTLISGLDQSDLYILWSESESKYFQDRLHTFYELTDKNIEREVFEIIYISRSLEFVI